MVILPSSLDTNMSQLLQEVSMGKMQLPEFQRSWTYIAEIKKNIF